MLYRAVQVRSDNCFTHVEAFLSQKAMNLCLFPLCYHKTCRTFEISTSLLSIVEISQVGQICKEGGNRHLGTAQLHK